MIQRRRYEPHKKKRNTSRLALALKKMVDVFIGLGDSASRLGAEDAQKTVMVDMATVWADSFGWPQSIGEMLMLERAMRAAAQVGFLPMLARLRQSQEGSK